MACRCPWLIIDVGETMSLNWGSGFKGQESFFFFLSVGITKEGRNIWMFLWPALSILVHLLEIMGCQDGIRCNGNR